MWATTKVAFTFVQLIGDCNLTQRKIFWFWLPLAASWALMMLQGPVIQGSIARLPQAVTILAAQGIVMSLSVTIESPVIMILATTTALATSPQAYRVLRRFVLHLNIILTIVAATIAFVDPVYDALVPGLMGIPLPIAQAAQPAMKIMTFWTAAIGWRRFFQGILIRFDKTRHVSYGTGVRLTSITVTMISLAIFSDLSGVVIASCSLMAGVTSEMIYAFFASRSPILMHLSGPDDPDQPDISYGEVAKYHAPLAATSLLTLLAQPMIGAGLARMAFPEENLAAWPVIFTIWLIFRSPSQALPETIVALLKGSKPYAPLRRFSLVVAAGATLALAVMLFTPLITFYLLIVTAVTVNLAQFIMAGAMVGLFLPALQALQSWFRGVLLVVKFTGSIYWGMGVNLLVTAIALVGGILWQAPGAPAAAVALSLGMLAEIIYLWWRTRPVQTRFQLAPTAGAAT